MQRYQDGVNKKGYNVRLPEIGNVIKSRARGSYRAHKTLDVQLLEYV